MKKLLFIALAVILPAWGFSETIFEDSFEYGNTEHQVPIGWTAPQEDWFCGKYESTHNCKPHGGNWYAYSESSDSWLFLPTNIIIGLHYRLSFWTITDGDYQIEIRCGDSARPEDMSTEIMAATAINATDYQEFSASYEFYDTKDIYLGFHIISNGGTALCLDDVTIEQEHQYAFIAKAITTDTLEIEHGASADFRFLIYNTGYDQEILTLNSPSEMFHSTHYYINGESVNRIQIEPRETIVVDVTSTLTEDPVPYPFAWLDIMVCSTHNCNTGMVTFFAKPVVPSQVIESNKSISIFPNPAQEFIYIDADDIQENIIFDCNGRQIISTTEKTIYVGDLATGIYTIITKTGKHPLRQHFIKQ